MNVSIESATLLLNETAGYLKAANKDVYAREVQSIEEMVFRIQNDRIDPVALARVFSHLIIFAKQTI